MTSPRLSCVFSLWVLLAVATASAQPKIPPPTLKALLADDLVARARIRWSKVEENNRIEILIFGGMAERLNPKWAKRPARLPYDLEQHRQLAAAIKKAKLGQPGTTQGTELRTLELLGRDGASPSGYSVVATFTLPKAKWQKLHPALFQALEPLFSAQQENWVSPP